MAAARARVFIIYMYAYTNLSKYKLACERQKKAYLISGALLYYDKCGGIQIEITNLLSL